MLGRPVSGMRTDHRMVRRLGGRGCRCLVAPGVAGREVTTGLPGGVRGGEVRQECPQRGRQRFVRRGHVGPDGVASDVGHDDGVEHRAERRMLLERQVAVPHIGASAVLGIERQDLGMALDARLDGMRGGEVAEARRQAGLRCGVERLLPEQQHLVFEQRAADGTRSSCRQVVTTDRRHCTSAPRTVVSGATAMSGIPRRYAVA